MSDLQPDLTGIAWRVNIESVVRNIFFRVDHAIAGAGGAAVDGKTRSAVSAVNSMEAMNQNIAINLQVLEIATREDVGITDDDYDHIDEGHFAVAHIIETASQIVYDTILDAGDEIVDDAVHDVVAAILPTTSSDEMAGRISVALTQCVFNGE